MAKKKQPQSGDKTMPSGAPARSSDRKGSRHKPRKMISLLPRHYEALKELARRNQRPIVWEARIAIAKALVEAGLLTQEEADLVQADAGDEGGA
jgi:hypothetical protein